MKKKNKLIILLIILLILLFIFNKIFNIDSLEYKIKNEKDIFNIKEVYEKNNYYFEIKTNDFVYPINIYNIKQKRKLINKIYSYSDNDYNCILPLFNNEILSDMMCYYNNVIYNYQSIKNQNKSLDKYVESIKEYTNYNKEDKLTKKIDDTINLYNEIDKIISITTYKGIIVSGQEIELFNEDVYNNKVSAFINNYYIVADYNNNYEFNKFYIVNLLDKTISTIETKNDISFDSYIQGIVDDNIYLYDKDNEIQYEINVSKKKVDIVSTENYIKYYNNNIWEKMNITKANKVIYFDYTSRENKFSNYDYVYENEYYYYLLDKKDNFYKLYRVNKKNINIIKYLIDIPVSDINIKDDFVYYIDNDKMYFYSDITGLQLVLSNTELKFNNTIKYYIY